MVTKTTTVIIEDGEVLIHRIYDSGNEFYLDKNGLCHRPNNKPTLICPDGYTEYRVHGEWHRTDGPAIVYPDGRRLFYLDGKEYTKEDYWDEIERQKAR